MKLINQSAEIWEQPEGEIGIYKQVERAARLCYKSEDKVTEDSYKRFIDMLNTNGHQSPLEHGTIYLQYEVIEGVCNPLSKYYNDIYSKVNYNVNQVSVRLFVTTNYRVIKERGWEEDLKYLCEPTEYHEKRISVHITTSIGISRAWSNSLEEAEYNYLLLLKQGWKPQQARDVLPLATKTELIHTAFESDWKEFFKLRCSPAAHPMMQELANQIKELIQNHK